MIKKNKIIIFIIILILLVLILRSTYSKYVGEAATGIAKTIAKWNIKVNDTDITEPLPEGQTVSTFQINNFIWNNVNTSTGVAAPGSRGTFDLKLDFKGTQVSVEYIITINQQALSQNNNMRLVLSGVRQSNGTSIPFNTNQAGIVEIRRIKTYSDIYNNPVDNIQVELTWENDDQHNNQDSNLGSIPNNTINLPVEINFKQYTG